jgi:uncharacterized protein YcnI
MAIGLLAAAPAWAHVHVDADNPTPGAETVLTFNVPNESDKGALTTQLSITLPDVVSASTEAMPGWTARLDRNVAAGTVHSVTWTAAPGTGIPADQFALFRISVTLPDAKTVSLPATQTYSDGTVVKWDQPTAPNGAEPEHPVPEIALTGTKTGDGDMPTAVASARPAPPDHTSRWLAAGALALSVIAVATTLLVRRRA